MPVDCQQERLGSGGDTAKESLRWPARVPGARASGWPFARDLCSSLPGLWTAQVHTPRDAHMRARAHIHGRRTLQGGSQRPALHHRASGGGPRAPTLSPFCRGRRLSELFRVLRETTQSRPQRATRKLDPLLCRCTLGPVHTTGEPDEPVACPWGGEAGVCIRSRRPSRWRYGTRPDVAESPGARYPAKEYLRDLARDSSQDPASLENHTQQPLLAYLHD